MFSAENGGESHFCWDFMNRANALELCEFNIQCSIKDKRISHPTSAAFRTAFSTPPAADTCAPTFHWLETRTGKSSVKDSSSIFFRFFCAGVLAAKKLMIHV
jgi:hypothetical protein